MRVWEITTLSVVAASASISQFAVASIFLVAGLGKAAGFSGFQETVRGLGFGAGSARALGTLLISVELSTAVSLVAMPGRVAPRLVALGLAISFALVGAFAIATSRNLPCNCIGALGSSSLGWRQLALLPIWSLLLFVAQEGSITWQPDLGLAGLGLVLLLLTVQKLMRTRFLFQSLRADRLALSVHLAAAAARGISIVREEA